MKPGKTEGCEAVRAACASRAEGCPRPEGGKANLSHHQEPRMEEGGKGTEYTGNQKGNLSGSRALPWHNLPSQETFKILSHGTGSQPPLLEHFHLYPRERHCCNKAVPASGVVHWKHLGELHCSCPLFSANMPQGSNYRASQSSHPRQSTNPQGSKYLGKQRPADKTIPV